MNPETAINFDGLAFLDELENVFKLSGMNGVIHLVQDSFPIGRQIKMKQQGMNSIATVYSIERVSVTNMTSEEVIWTAGDNLSESIIRGISLPYVSQPFQIRIYGNDAS